MRSDYAKRENMRRFVILIAGTKHGETTDRDQAEYVKRLLESDGHKDVSIRVRTANQED